MYNTGSLIIDKEDHKFLATGILAGLITIPIGTFVGGLVAGFELPMILSNSVPTVIVSLLLAVGLWKIFDKMTRGFTVFGRGVVIVITIGLAVIIIETLTEIVVIPGIAPVSDSIAIVGDIALMLAGAFPMVHFITKVFRKPLLQLGKLLGMGDVAVAGKLTAGITAVILAIFIANRRVEKTQES
ncbi:ethanolamine utilization protein EutH [Schnuerera ultunensis]|uniref:ethanolamine utilization protein EutH n=1 Tax=Schnuerera ultunensis TaxID=45497 RepID=UPI0038B4D3A2